MQANKLPDVLSVRACVTLAAELDFAYAWSVGHNGFWVTLLFFISCALASILDTPVQNARSGNGVISPRLQHGTQFVYSM